MASESNPDSPDIEIDTATLGGPRSTALMTHASPPSDSDPIAIAARGREITKESLFGNTTDDSDVARIHELVAEMNRDIPAGGVDIEYGSQVTQRLRFWKSALHKPPLILFVHGGSWRSGTYLDSIGSAKVTHLTDKGYTFATVNYTLVPYVTVEEQVQEVADSLGYLVQNAARLGFHPERIVLMGHSSGAHIVTLLGTDSGYLDRAGVGIANVQGIIALDGSNYNALAETIDSPGPVAENTTYALGTDPNRLRAVSPVHHACGPKARAFLLLHVQRNGDIRQAMELSLVLTAAGTKNALHVFEGQGFEGHMQMLLRIGDPSYPATGVMTTWLQEHVPIEQ
ncbi:hypothetical protein CDD83_9960 [Cordyceps sp. RAO-2017]|nr:hypothetical protein CDD83_9960 [Cordyceps sp. RAO-2017]